LSFNRLPSIKVGTFNSLSKLLLLDLFYNHITSIDDGAFNGMTHLFVLDLDLNNIRTLSSGLFVGLQNIIDIFLSGCFKSRIPVNTFVYVPTLELLDLSFNTISIVEDSAFTSLSELVGLGNYIFIIN
jgi:Leucine-rich repeat (LRR) protein